MTREEAKKEIEKVFEPAFANYIIKALTDGATESDVEPQEWIPVKDRLPESRELVLVTAYWHERYQVMMASYFGKGEWWCVPWNNCGEHMQKLKPIAWMPLPSPYKGE